MIIDVFKKYSEFEKLRENWGVLYQVDPEARLFLSWEWLSQEFLRRPDHWFYILAARPNPTENDYVAFFPLRLTLRTRGSNQRFHNELQMAGNYWADYNGFICHPEHEQQAIPALAMQLKKMYWARLHLDFILMSDRRLALLLNPFKDDAYVISHGNRLSEEDNIDSLIAPYADLPDNFESFLATHMSAKTRQKLRRYTRKVVNSPELRITHTNTETSERDLSAFGNFWLTKWAERKGKKANRLAKTYQQMLRQALQARILFMPVLWRANQPIGMLGSLIDRQKQSLLFFVAGRDESVRDLPIGLILHGHSLRWAIEQGLQKYDFLAGNERYKYAYGVKEQQLRCITVSTKSKINLNGMLDPRCTQAALERATYSHQKGEIPLARNGYQQVLQVRPDDSQTLRRYGRLLSESGENTKALAIHQRIVASQPYNASAWTNLGEVFFFMGAYQDARSVLENAVELSANQSIKALYFLGRSLSILDRKSAALAAYNAVLELSPASRRDERRQQKVHKYLIDLGER